MVRQFHNPVALTPQTAELIQVSVARCLHEILVDGGLVRNNGIGSTNVFDLYNSTEHIAVDIRRLVSTSRTPKPVEDPLTLDPELATQVQREAFHGDEKSGMRKLCVNAVLIDDQDGGQDAGHLMAYAPWKDDVVDTSSGSLSQRIVFSDDCQEAVLARALSKNKTHVIRTGVLDGIHAMADLLDAELNEI
jgi:hypothetical protein